MERPHPLIGLDGGCNPMNDLHGYAKRVEVYLAKIRQSSLSEKNKELIERFVNECYSEGLTNGRIQKYLYHLYYIALMLGKDFNLSTSDDLKTVVRQIDYRSDYSENTKRDFRIALKKFYKWIGGGTVPECALWIKTGSKHAKMLLPEELLTESDIRDLVTAANNPRDKAFIFVLYESGCRIGELLNTRLKNVSFDNYGAQIIVNGKTGSRRVRIILACDYLRYWCENHPRREDPESNLWVAMSNNNRGAALEYRAMYKRLYDIAKKAGVKKRVNFHNFRHARATWLAGKLTESQLCEVLGWTLSSKMPATYVHLSGRNVDDALLKMYGLKEKADQENTICPRCKTTNDQVSRYCMKCGLPFGLDVALKAEQQRGSYDDMMSKLMEDEGVREAISKAIQRSGFKIN